MKNDYVVNLAWTVPLEITFDEVQFLMLGKFIFKSLNWRTIGKPCTSDENILVSNGVVFYGQRVFVWDAFANMQFSSCSLKWCKPKKTHNSTWLFYYAVQSWQVRTIQISFISLPCNWIIRLSHHTKELCAIYTLVPFTPTQKARILGVVCAIPLSHHVINICNVERKCVHTLKMYLLKFSNLKQNLAVSFACNSLAFHLVPFDWWLPCFPPPHKIPQNAMIWHHSAGHSGKLYYQELLRAIHHVLGGHSRKKIWLPPAERNWEDC